MDIYTLFGQTVDGEKKFNEWSDVLMNRRRKEDIGM